MLRKKLLASAVLAALAAYGANQLGSRDAVVRAAAAEPLPAATYGLPDFTALVAQAGPAVVSIQTTRAVPAGGWQRDDAPPNGQAFPFPEFFRHFGPPPGEDDVRQGQGSGFIVSADGYVLTNAHVVEGADEVTVLLADKREFNAKVVGVDGTSDVAVLKLPVNDLPSLKMGDANGLKVGEWVIAIGSPFGFDHTVSAGVVSAKGRSLPNGGYVPFIQTDVALNPGNSGGPLLNLRGEVVGINSQIYSRSGGYMGLSFAIPIDLAQSIQQQLVADGKVSRGRLGVSVQSLNQELADSFGLKRPAGALIGSVQAGSAAARAGIKAGDVVTAANGQAIEDAAQLSRVIAELKPGSKVALEYVRSGKRQTLSVALGAAETEEVASREDAGPGHVGRLGAVVQPLDEATRQATGETRGVLVAQVDGAAARAGLRAGDIILAVNSTAVRNPAELQSMLADAPSQVALLVKREDAEIFVPVRLG